MFDTLKGWVEHIGALNSIIPGLAQPISWRATKSLLSHQNTIIYTCNIISTLSAGPLSMAQLILFPTNIWELPSEQIFGRFSLYSQFAPSSCHIFGERCVCEKKNLFAFVPGEKAPPPPSILPLFVLLIPIIVKIFYDQSKLDVFLIHEIRQKRGGRHLLGRALTQKGGAKMGPIGTRDRPSGKS